MSSPGGQQLSWSFLPMNSRQPCPLVAVSVHLSGQASQSGAAANRIAIEAALRKFSGMDPLDPKRRQVKEIRRSPGLSFRERCCFEPKDAFSILGRSRARGEASALQRMARLHRVQVLIYRNAPGAKLTTLATLILVAPTLVTPITSEIATAQTHASCAASSATRARSTGIHSRRP